MSIIIVILSVISFYSCLRGSSQILSFEVQDSYTFTGLLQENEKVYFCFVKRKFNPNIKIFDERGVLKDSVSLVNADNLLGSVKSIWMSSLDSICVYSHHSGKLVIIDKDGLIKSQRDYYNMTDKNGNKYELLSPHPYRPFGVHENKDIVLSAIGWRGNDNRNYTSKLVVDNTRNGFQVCKINPFSEDCEFGVNFADIVEFSDFVDTTLYFAPRHNVCILNDKYFMISDYSRYIYQLSEDLSVKNKFKIIDDSSSILRLLPLTMEDDLQSLLNETLEISKTSISVSNILYNNVSRNYIVILKNGFIKNSEWHNFPFKIHLYDENFMKIKSVEVNSYDYIPLKSFVWNGKLYIEKKSKLPNHKEYEIIEL